MGYESMQVDGKAQRGAVPDRLFQPGSVRKPAAPRKARMIVQSADLQGEITTRSGHPQSASGQFQSTRSSSWLTRSNDLVEWEQARVFDRRGAVSHSSQVFCI